MRDCFWENLPLDELSVAEWEALCDGCAKCCLTKLLDSDTDEVHFTAVACRQLNAETCRCRDYARRRSIVAGCIKVSLDMDWRWLPTTCAYRLRAENKPLPDWHPLVSGSPRSVHQAGVSVRGKVVPEDSVHPAELQRFIVRWP